MDENEARTLAAQIGGEPHHSGGGIWLVFATTRLGAFRVISDDMDCVYESREAFDRGDEPGDVHILDED